MDEPRDLLTFSRPRGPREDLAFIRRTLADAGHLSIVPGRGMVLIGLLAMLTVWLNEKVPGGAPWSAAYLARLRANDAELGRLPHPESILLWGALLGLAAAIGLFSMQQKAKRTGQLFWSPVLKRAAWGYIAAMLFGGLLTISLLNRPELLPEVWLGCYGVGLVGAGAVSISPIRWMGLCFLVLAGLAAFTQISGSILLAAGFGWLHIGFGAYIAWRHDG